MRLTLRNLLAYMHGLLSPQEAEELARKIAESPFAKDLIERITDVVRRRSAELLSADDEATQLDPNTVAEYLDHVLPPERVPDFERICFESDQQLAEIASCHLILTKVLTEPVQISDEARRRMYALIQDLPPQPRSEQPPEVSAEPQAEGKQAGGKRPPKKRRLYLPGPRVVLRMVLTAFFGALALGFGVIGLLLLTGQLRPDSALMAFLRGAEGRGGRAVARLPEGGKELPAPEAVSPSPEATPPASHTQSESAPAEESPGQTGAGPITPSTVPPVSDQTVSLPSEPGAVPPAPGTAPLGETDRASAEAGELASRPSEPAAAEMAAGLEQPEAVLREFAGGGTPGQSPAGEAAVAERGAPSAGIPVDRPKPGRELRVELLSEGEVLLFFDAGKSAWCRVARQEPVPLNSDLLCLPRFAPVLRVGSQMTVKMVDATKLNFVAGQAEGQLKLAISFGRLLFRDIPEKWSIELGPPLNVNIVAATPGAQMALEVYGRQYGPRLPKDAPPRLATLYWLAGKGNVVLSTGEVHAVESVCELAIDGAGKPQPAASLPAWTKWDSEFEQIDLLARPVVAEALKPEAPVVVRLRELARHRKQEVRLLAYRALHVVDDFEPLVEALGNNEESVHWKEVVGLLATAYSAGSPTTERILAAVDRFHGAACGRIAAVSLDLNAPLEAGSARLLVDALREPVLAARVLALWRLEQEAGRAFGYRASDDPRNQRAALSRWEEWFRERFGAGGPGRNPAEALLLPQ